MLHILPGWWRQRIVEPLHPDDAARVADIHSEAFERGWSTDEIAAIIAEPSVLALRLRLVDTQRPSRIDGFILMRFAADEAEVLSVAVAQARRGRGFGRKLVESGLRHAYERGTARVFLEVDASNTAASNLYRAIGFVTVAERPAYYAHGAGEATPALVMRYDLRGGHATTEHQTEAVPRETRGNS